MNNRNKVRKAVLYAIFEEHGPEFEKFHNRVKDNVTFSKHRIAEGKVIVNIMRTKYGYSPTTFDGDIVHTAYYNWKKWQKMARTRKAKSFKIKNGKDELHVTHVSDTYIIASKDKNFTKKLKYNIDDLELSTKDRSTITKQMDKKMSK